MILDRSYSKVLFVNNQENMRGQKGTERDTEGVGCDMS